jgi:hypothetical protein
MTKQINNFFLAMIIYVGIASTVIFSQNDNQFDNASGIDLNKLLNQQQNQDVLVNQNSQYESGVYTTDIDLNEEESTPIFNQYVFDQKEGIVFEDVAELHKQYLIEKQMIYVQEKNEDIIEYDEEKQKTEDVVVSNVGVLQNQEFKMTNNFSQREPKNLNMPQRTNPIDRIVDTYEFQSVNQFSQESGTNSEKIKLIK